MKEKIKVLIVDDSAIVRNTLSEYLSNYKNIEIVGTAPDPYIARDKIVKLNPDVITLDIEMPRMDGLSFLKRLMTYYPLPVIIVSSVTTNDKYAAIKALEIGAFEVVNKPSGSISIDKVLEEVALKIMQAYQVKGNFVNRFKALTPKVERERKPKGKEQGPILKNISTTDKLIAIGASTGGTVALEFLLTQLPANLPPIVIVQHMPAGFTKQFADRLNDISELKVKEAVDKEILVNGSVYIAPGGYHLAIERKGASVYTKLLDTERVHFQKPAVDILFDSVAQISGKNALGVLLTGMGKDGAKGLLKMKDNGAHTIAQDEKSSVVWGMPRAAYEINASKEVLPLDEIPEKIIRFT